MFEALEEALVKILQKLDFQEELLQLTISSLNTKKQVAKFLGVSTSTVSTYIKDGRFTEEIHYFNNQDGKEEFIPEGIIKFKQELKHRKYEVKKVEKTLNPIASKFLNNRKVVSNG
ncbi:hypothetical protein [Sulfurimonas sp.]|uniref:helix-turn-helix transcriptional regulator n=1 Tax=Sulfurimonas sp. TaxID=2022749 RepID=UPI0026074B93|nr:hypothetical protein [Sulfurimonas sp.]MDD5156844.1 hypothetical protein [Sulfurimonas sp.]